MASGLETLLLRGQQQQGQDGASAVLSASEAERLIEGLHAFQVEDVGSSKWQSQHDALSQLNLQAHHNARTHSDEFVVDLLVSLNKVQTLVHDLLVIEAWRDHVLPHLRKHLAEHMDPLSSYMLLYQECAVANFIEIVLYNPQAVEATPEDYLLELADWAYRKLAYLNSKEAAAVAEVKERTAQELLSMTPLQELEQRVAELQFASAMSALSIVRYLTDHLSTAPMSLLSRLVATNDTVMALLPLLERPPWVRRRKGKMERWEARGMLWSPVDAADRLKLGQFEVQVWLAVNNLVVDPKARAKYHMDEYRKEKLLGLKRYLNELLFDQLPVLKDLQRVLDEIGLGMGAADKEAYKQAGLILEQVPLIREALVKGKDWRVVAVTQAQTHFAKDRTVDKAKIDAISKLLDRMCEMEVPESDTQGPAAAAGAGRDAPAGTSLPGPVSVECRRKVHESGVWEPFCQVELSVDPSRPPDPVEVAAPSPVGGTGRAVEAVHGLRYRLQAVDPAGTQPLPSNGKIVFKVPLPDSSLMVAEALLQLPDAPLKDAVAELPPVVWVTAGLLATDGAVLQLKLQRAAKPQVRDRTSGVWYAYHPCGGALTIRRDEPGARNQSQATSTGTATSTSRVTPKISPLPSKPQPAAPRPAAAAPSSAPSPAVPLVPIGALNALSTVAAGPAAVSLVGVAASGQKAVNVAPGCGCVGQAGAAVEVIMDGQQHGMVDDLNLPD